MSYYRDHRSARTRAVAVIGEWPGRTSPRAKRAALSGGTIAGNWSHDHAARVWVESREVLAQTAGRLGEAHLEENARLAYVGLIGSHISGCARCWRVGIYEDPRAATPAVWLAWAVGRRPGLRDVFEPVWREVSGQRLSLAAPAVTR